MKKTATVKKETAPSKTKTDPLIGKRFSFERDNVIYAGRIESRISSGMYFVRFNDNHLGHVVSVQRMEKLNFIFGKAQ